MSTWSLDPRTIEVPANFHLQRSAYNGRFVEEWRKDQVKYWTKGYVHTWLIPLTILMAATLCTMVEANYLSKTALDGALVVGICVMTMGVGLGVAVGVGVHTWMKVAFDDNEPMRRIRVATKVASIMTNLALFR